MKKVFAYTLVSTLVLAALSGCDNDSKKKTVPEAQKPQVTVSTNKAADQVKNDAAAPAAKAAAPAGKKEEAPKAFDLGSPEKNYSYALGATIGSDFYRNMKASEEMDIRFDVAAMKAGFSDSLEGKNKLSDEERMKFLSVLENEVKTKMEAKTKAENEKNLQEGREFLAKNAKAEGVNVTASGLQYRVNVQGTGDRVESNDDIVSVLYTGKLVNGKVFDSNETEGKAPLEFPVGGVIQGWQEGIKLMTVGSDYDFFIPAELAYGDQKMPGNVIPPNSTLIFHVKLVGIKHAHATDGKSGASAPQDEQPKQESEVQQGEVKTDVPAEQPKQESEVQQGEVKTDVPAEQPKEEKNIPQVDADAEDL